MSSFTTPLKVEYLDGECIAMGLDAKGEKP